MYHCLLVLYDKEEEYAQLMTEFLKKHRDLPWEIHTYTKKEQLMQKEAKQAISILMVSESVYEEELKELKPQRMILLKESNLYGFEDVFCVNKYQCAENVLKAVLEVYVEISDTSLAVFSQDNLTQFIGVYSPVSTDLQTTFALTMSQLLSQKHTVLYLNFAPYIGITELMPDSNTKDISDLLYFLTLEKEKFWLRMQTMVRQKINFYYIPPMKLPFHLLTVPVSEWIKLFQRIKEIGQYEYIILDLSDSMQGLFEVLKLCKVIFSFTQNDKISRNKFLQYEQILEWHEYEDILQKTEKCFFAGSKKVSQELEFYTRGEFAQYVQRQIENKL